MSRRRKVVVFSPPPNTRTSFLNDGGYPKNMHFVALSPNWSTPGLLNPGWKISQFRHLQIIQHPTPKINLHSPAPLLSVEWLSLLHISRRSTDFVQSNFEHCSSTETHWRLAGPAFPESTSIQILSVCSEIPLYPLNSGKQL